MLSECHCSENKDPVYIAGSKTADDWDKTKQRLRPGEDPALWGSIADEFYMARLELRYLSPINLLQKYGAWRGEGFSIVAIQCTLVEFLESTVQGKNYRYSTRGTAPGAYEYSKSKCIFVNFLTSRAPFSTEFNDALAKNFYTGVRCGLLHEARTKDGWRIRAENPEGRIIDPDNRIVFRNGFQTALLKFIKSYKKELKANAEYQEAFIRKFDSLCR